MTRRLVLLFLLAGCRPSTSPQKLCAVEVFASAPPPPTENLGPVSARCDPSFTDDECLQTLKEQVCKMGGDTVWGVDEPALREGKKHLSARAARRK